MWDLPGPAIEPVSPASAGGFLTTEPPGEPVLGFQCMNLGGNTAFSPKHHSKGERAERSKDAQSGLLDVSMRYALGKSVVLTWNGPQWLACCSF